MVVTDAQRNAFYAAAVAGLRLLDSRERSPRRFGAEADARWVAFKGALSDADRIDLLLSDGSVSWGVAFSPAEVFDLFGLAPDEPFGPDWRPLAPTAARRLLQGPAETTDPSAFAALLGLEPASVQLPPITSSTRLAVTGGAALVAVAQAFAGQPGLSWSDQVLAVAETPAHRQLAGLLAIAVGSNGRTRLTRPGDDLRAVLKQAGFTQIDVAVASPDAEPTCAAFAHRSAGVA